MNVNNALVFRVCINYSKLAQNSESAMQMLHACTFPH